MHEKSVVDGSSGCGLRGLEKSFCKFVESSWVASLFRGSTFWRAVGASWKPLWGDLLGPLGGLRGLILAFLTALLSLHLTQISAGTQGEVVLFWGGKITRVLKRTPTRQNPSGSITGHLWACNSFAGRHASPGPQ